MRLPRKLKKGIRTIRNGRPRTKWQRKGQAKFSTTMMRMSLTASLYAITMSKVNEILTKGMHLKPGGIVRSDPPQVNNKGEVVITKDEAQRLADYINSGPSSAITCTISSDRLKEGLNKLKLRTNIL